MYMWWSICCNQLVVSFWIYEIEYPLYNISIINKKSRRNKRWIKIKTSYNLETDKFISLWISFSLFSGASFSEDDGMPSNSKKVAYHDRSSIVHGLSVFSSSLENIHIEKYTPINRLENDRIISSIYQKEKFDELDGSHISSISFVHNVCFPRYPSCGSICGAVIIRPHNSEFHVW